VKAVSFFLVLSTFLLTSRITHFPFHPGPSGIPLRSFDVKGWQRGRQAYLKVLHPTLQPDSGFFYDYLIFFILSVSNLLDNNFHDNNHSSSAVVGFLILLLSTFTFITSIFFLLSRHPEKIDLSFDPLEVFIAMHSHESPPLPG